MNERWDAFRVHWDPFDPDMERDSSPEEDVRLRERYDWAKAKRSDVIEATIYIENVLDYLLCACMAGASFEASNRFRGLVLSSEFFTLFQKWRLLRALLDDRGLFPESAPIPSRKENLRALHDLIEMRNAYAHGDLSIDRKTTTAYLNYFSSPTPIVVSEETVSKILSDATRLHSWLESLYARFKPDDRAPT